MKTFATCITAALASQRLSVPDFLTHLGYTNMAKGRRRYDAWLQTGRLPKGWESKRIADLLGLESCVLDTTPHTSPRTAHRTAPNVGSAAPPSPAYICRLWGGKSDLSLVADALGALQHVLLLGPAGCGKTALVQAVATRTGRPLFQAPCHGGVGVEMLLGQWVPHPQGQGYLWMDGVITTAVRDGGILYLDEVNSLRPEVAFTVHALLDQRRELVLMDKPGADGRPERLKAHPEFRCIASGNPGYAGTRPLNRAFRDRFACQLTFHPHPRMDEAVLKAQASWERLGRDQQQGLAQLCDAIRTAQRKEELDPDLGTRALIAFADNWVLHGYAVAKLQLLERVDEDERQVLAGLCEKIWTETGAAFTSPNVAMARQGACE